VLILVTDGANNGADRPADRRAPGGQEGVKIYPSASAPTRNRVAPWDPGINPSLDLDEPALKAIAEATGGQYFRARDGKELQAIKDTLDQLEPVNSNRPRPARPRPVQWPLALALLLSMLLVQERWPNNALQRCLPRSFPATAP
jgi:Ca-activated chloride channel family protein